MKRKYLLVFVVFILLIGLCACMTADPSNGSVAIQFETVAVESEQPNLSESAVFDETVNENDEETQEELWWHDEALYEQYTLYAMPYAKAMLCGTTWSDPAKIEVWQLINFYMYNSFAENEEYLALGDVEEILVPENEVIGYITTFFNVSPDYIKTSEKYLADQNAFRFQPYMGGGMGPLARFTCDTVDDKLYLQFENEFDGKIQPYYMLTVQLDADGGYKYIEGIRLI